MSDKLAEEITLTIGQAFELAYKRFLETSGRDIELKKQLMSLQKKITSLEYENTELKTRLKDVAHIKGQQDIQAYMAANKVLTSLGAVNLIQIRFHFNSNQKGLIKVNAC